MSPPRQTRIRWPAALVTLVGVALLVWVGLSRLDLEADIVGALPGDDPVLDGAAYVLEKHPALDRIAVDISLSDGSADRDALVEAANRLEAALEETGLFFRIGNEAVAVGMLRFLSDTATQLPLHFDEAMLEESLEGRLSREALDATVAQRVRELTGLDGIGQAQLLTRDPLGLRDGVLARAVALLPTSEAELYRGHLLSADGRHLLMVAEPAGSGTDTNFARRLDAALDETFAALNDEASDGRKIHAVPVGAYRAALDNERTARQDTQRAVLLTSVLLVLLLILFFPRPWMGLLSLFPALAGTAAGLALFSLFESSIWLLALGFGGAIISITVDHGIAYLLLLDRESGATGRDASRELWSVGFLAALTSVGAFLSLRWSGFPVLEQLGLFAALGIGCSFLFVHTILPWVLPEMGPARRPRTLNLQRITALTVRGGTRGRLVLAGLLVVGLGLFARPEFQADLGAMNAVSPETLAAEELVKTRWGDVLGRVSLLIEAPDPAALQARTDRLADLIDREVESSALASGYSPSHLYPGSARAGENLAAWESFWTPPRRRALEVGLTAAAQHHGLTTQAFAPFLRSVEAPTVQAVPPPPELYPLLGITETDDGLLAMAAVTPGPRYDGARFFSQATGIPGVQVLDPEHFTDRLSDVLFETFGWMLVIIGTGVGVLLALFFLGWRLPVLVAAPIAFALICTLGTLGLLGRPLDIPALILGVVVMGMGIDYAVFLCRSYQRHRAEGADAFLPVWSAVLLACLSTLAGFGTLALSDHVLLAGAGLTGFLAIGYAGLGTFLLLPPLLHRIFRDQPPPSAAGTAAGSPEHRVATLARYRLMEPYPRQFARFKLQLDPMFPGLAEQIRPGDRVLDVGCGYGVPGAWILALDDDARVWGVEPDPERVRVARRAWGERGIVHLGAAPKLPSEPRRVDLALMLDMAHHLDDAALDHTLADLRGRLGDEGRLSLRVTVPTDKAFPWERHMERIRFRLLGLGRPKFRSVARLCDRLEVAGFEVRTIASTAPGREETWFHVIARQDHTEEAP